jgi:TRAP-type C4-dicarboxylate transport system permease small subunit
VTEVKPLSTVTGLWIDSELKGLVVKALNWIFHAAGILSAILLAAMAILTLLQIVGRTLGYNISTGADFAGFCMAASIFLALAWTLRSGGHIRVSLFIQVLNPKMRFAFEIWCLVVASLAVAFFAYSAVSMTWDSYRFGDMSVGMVAVPLWLPQTAMAAGAVLMGIALVEQLILVLLGQDPIYRASEEGKNEDDDATHQGVK